MGGKKIPIELQSYGVYVITSAAHPLRAYIGSTSVQFHRRWYEHKRQMRLGAHDNQALQSIWNKYGDCAFSFLILENLTGQDDSAVLDREQYWMDWYRESGYRLFNMSPVAGTQRGYRHTEETRKKLSEAGKKSYTGREQIIKRTKTKGVCYSFRAPDGAIHTDIYDLKEWCIQRRLDHPSMQRVWNKYSRSHCGWTLVDSEYRPPVYVLLSPCNSTFIVKHKELNAFCVEQNLDLSNLWKVLKGKCHHCKGWTITVQQEGI